MSSYQFLKTKQLRWSKKYLSILLPMMAFFVTVSLSAAITSTNKVQAALNFTYGPLILVFLTVFYWYISQEEEDTVGLMLRFSGFCVSAITIILFFHPFDSVILPKTFQFLKNQNFSPVGTRTDLMLFLGFVTIYQFVRWLQTKRQTRQTDWLAILGVAVSTAALVLSFLTLTQKSPSGSVQATAPFNASLRATAKSLSTPVGFILGSGINNFSSVFTQIKDSSHNASASWAVNSYDNAYSAILQVLVESGFLSALALIGIFINGFFLSRSKASSILLGYIALAFIFAPASLIQFLLLYCSLGIIASDWVKNSKQVIIVSENKSLFLIGFINTSTLISLMILFVFGLVPVYRAEVAMRSSVDAVANNDLRELYNNQHRAVILNPYIERYRLNFSQTNLFVAKQMATRSNPDQAIITSSVQQAINEAQSAISLNPNKAANWENLGIIYKNVLGVKGAEQWAIAAFQRAIVLDPQNVSYRLELGGVFYSLKQYENAIKTFQEAVLLKPDLSNAYYNLAHSYYQSQNPKEAVRVMDALLILLKKQSYPSYEKVLKERNDFASGAPQN